MIIMKFGGTSLGSAERIKQAVDIVIKRKDQNPLVVVSAVGGITDLLLLASKEALEGQVDTSKIEEKHMQILADLKLPYNIVRADMEELKNVLIGISMLKELSPKTSDRLVSYGERLSSKVVAAYIDSLGVSSKQHCSYDLGMITTNTFQAAEPLPESDALLKKNIEEKNHLIVTTGFFGKTKEGDIATFGRGGSDYSASIIGSAVHAKEIQIWTDVRGVKTCDPRIVASAKTIEELSFNEAAELAYFGAKVLHPKTIQPAISKNIPVHVYNTGEPDKKGTVILKKAKRTKEIVKAISVRKGIRIIRICSTRMLDASGFLARIFEVFKKHEIVVDLIATSEVSVSLTVCESANIKRTVKELSEIGSVEVQEDKSIIAIVGEGLKEYNAFAGKTFTALGEEGMSIDMISQGSSQINLSFVIDTANTENALQKLHAVYFP